MKPFVGMIVHFHEIMQKQPWPAIIIALSSDDAAVEKGEVDLHVFSTISGGVHIARKIPMSEKPKEKEQCWSPIPPPTHVAVKSSDYTDHKGKK